MSAASNPAATWPVTAVSPQAGSYRHLAIAGTLIALAIYPLGIGLPALTVEKMGRIRESSVLSGCRNLFDDGRIFLACVIGVTALILPPLKLFGLLWIGVASETNPLRRKLAPLLTLIGRWGFLDLFVAGILVAWVQMNSLIRFEPRVGLIFFGISVLLSYLASIGLDRAGMGNTSMSITTNSETSAPKVDTTPPVVPAASSTTASSAKKKRWIIITLAVTALLAGLLGTWAYYRQGRNQLEVTVRFRDAYGLRPGAEVRHRGVIVGKVTEVRIRSDSEDVPVKIRLQPEAEHLARDGSEFYIVRPTVSLSNGIRGLDTAIGDVYVEVTRSTGVNGEAKTDFDGNEDPPLPRKIPGCQQFTVKANRLSMALTAGAWVKCSGFPIGHIRTVDLTPDGKGIQMTVCIEPKYLHLIDMQTKFSAASLVVMNGSMGSLFSMRLELPALSGGLEITLPKSPKGQAPEDYVFQLAE